MTWTDEHKVTHSVKGGGYSTGCDRDIPADWAGMMPGWPPPRQRDREPKPLTCIECIATEEP